MTPDQLGCLPTDGLRRLAAGRFVSNFITMVRAFGTFDRSSQVAQPHRLFDAAVTGLRDLSRGIGLTK